MWAHFAQWATTMWCMFGRSRLRCLLKLFFLLIFKDGPLENFDGFLKIALPFICLNTSVWARWKGIFKNKIRKIKKPNNNNFYRFFFSSWFETGLLKKYIFKKSKKIANEQQLYGVCPVQVVSGACLNFLFYDF
jgi:hypothetical protein